jgi:hypothetical protein
MRSDCQINDMKWTPVPFAAARTETCEVQRPGAASVRACFASRSHGRQTDFGTRQHWPRSVAVRSAKPSMIVAPSAHETVQQRLPPRSGHGLASCRCDQTANQARVDRRGAPAAPIVRDSRIVPWLPVRSRGEISASTGRATNPCVMAGPGPVTHVFRCRPQGRRGWPAFAGHDTGRSDPTVDDAVIARRALTTGADCRS